MFTTAKRTHPEGGRPLRRRTLILTDTTDLPIAANGTSAGIRDHDGVAHSLASIQVAFSSNKRRKAMANGRWSRR
jgi:hypothetical protein